jgi:SAM-dependent methyltransferase
VKEGKEKPPTRKIPMRLVRCDPTRDERACGLLQMEHTVPPEVLYSSYWYRSGTNDTMRAHLKSIAEEASGLIGKRAARVLDIGCNDGTLLASYPREFEKIGIDPSDVAESARGEAAVVKGLFPSVELVELLQGKKCDVVTSIAMFYDLEDPVAFARAVKNILADDGIWVLEMSYMPAMLTMNSYDTICHEHLEYYSLAVLERIMKDASLKVVNAVQNDINGGSIRCHVTHADNLVFGKKEFDANIRRLRREEFDFELDTDKPYVDFQSRIDAHKKELRSLLTGLKRRGKRIHLYGASTKGNTILQWCGINKQFVDVAADRNPDKFGAHTLGTDIPIVSEAASRRSMPDYYLVLPWHFKEEFVHRERQMIRKGVCFIFPLPRVEIVGKERVRT